MINYHNKKFKAISNSDNGELSKNFIFDYKQKKNVLSCIYKGGTIIKGHILGLVSSDGTITMSYHQINSKGELQTGTCTSKPKVLTNGKIQLNESWQWTNGDKSKGTSVLIEV